MNVNTYLLIWQRADHNVIRKSLNLTKTRVQALKRNSIVLQFCLWIQLHCVKHSLFQRGL